MDVKELKKISKKLKPILSIGKNGLTQGSIELIERELKQKELIKLKILSAASDNDSKEDLLGTIIEKTGAKKIDAIGNIVVIYKKK